MGKKADSIKRAAIELSELERTAEENAKVAIVETFSPKLTEWFEASLKEIDDEDMEDEYEDDEDLEEGTEHDIGKQPGELARDSGAEKEEPELEEGKVNEEWEAIHGTSANRPEKVSKKDGWDKVHDGDYEEDPGENEDSQEGEEVANKTGGGAKKPPMEDPGKSEEKQPGEEVANKTGGGVTPPNAGDPGSSEEKQDGKLSGRKGLKEAFDDMEDDEELGDIEDDEDVFDEADDEDYDNEEGDEELDIPSGLLDDEDEEVSDSPEEADDGPELSIEEPLDDDDEEIDFDLEDDPEDEGELDLSPAGEEEDMEEGLYLRREGKFVKVSPEEALQTRMSELEEENARITKALTAMRGQLGEAHLFNAKLAHVNRLYQSGMFSSKEKLDIAEKIDECKSIDEVKTTYVSIVTEAKDKNPLDNYHKLLGERRESKSVKKENIYESAEVRRMKNLAGINEG